MRILVLSDLHDDFWSECNRNPFDGIEGLIADLDHVLLAGDISNKPKIRWKYAFERLSRLLPLERVSVFPGNHDFYDFCIDGENRLVCWGTLGYCARHFGQTLNLEMEVR